MPQFRCPGSIRSATPRPLERVCKHCGKKVEMFSDEEMVRCKCGAMVFKEREPTCASWCPAAERCLAGIVDVKAIRKARSVVESKKGKEYVERVCEMIQRKAGHKE